MTRLIAAIAKRKPAEKIVAMTLPAALSVSNCASALAVAAIATEAIRITALCPIANHRPTLIGRVPSCISLRVTLSIAAMWSASTAWRSPSVQASSAVPSMAGAAWNRLPAQIHAPIFAARSSANSAMMRARKRRLRLGWSPVIGPPAAV